MLQFIRSKAGSLIVKLLFAVLIFAFGAWGIGDIFRQRTAAETTVAKVGDIKIQADELQRAVHQEIERMRPLFGGNFDIEQAKQFGLVGSALDRIVSADLMDLEERRLKLLVDDQVVRNAILANPAFQGGNGTFDRNVFNNILANNHLTEDRYVALLRRDIARTALLGAVTGGAAAPSELTGPIYRTRNEKRVADTVLVPSDKMTSIADPTDAELQEFHDKRQDLFHSPEYRGFTALVAKPEDIAAGIEVPESKLREEYQSRLDEFQTPERRELEQILVADESKANEAAAQLAAGKDFATVAKDVANQDDEAIKLGWVGRDEMPPALADAAFALAKDGTTKPIQSPLGWHIIRVTDIQPAGAKSFEEAKPELAVTVAHDMAADQLAKQENDVEDALAGGATLAEVADRFKLKTITVASVDPDGHAPKGDTVELPDPDVLHLAFSTDQGSTSRVTETKDNGFFVVHVDSVTPSAVQPLAEVKDHAKELWLADKRSAAAEATAKDIAASVAQGKSLAELAAAKQLTVTATPAVTRTGGGQANLPASLVARIFELKSGEAGVSSGTNGWYVAQLKSIEEPDPAADKPAVAQVSSQLTESIRNDLLTQFEKALRGRFPVEVHQQEIDRLL
jgi:peptidyl-prolyl cis-trans isomerase D